MTTTKTKAKTATDARQLVADAVAELRGVEERMRGRERVLLAQETDLRRAVAAGAPDAEAALARLRRTLADVQQAAAVMRAEIDRLEAAA